MTALQIEKFPLGNDRRPLDLQAAVLVDASGNDGEQLPVQVLGPDKAPIDMMGIMLLKRDGTVFDPDAFTPPPPFVSPDKTIFLNEEDYGWKTDGTLNDPTVLETVINLYGTGARIVFPMGRSRLSRSIIPGKPCILEGYGGGKRQSGGNGRTELEAPAGHPIFVLGVAAQGTYIRNMKFLHNAMLIGEGTASYDSISSLLTITGNTLMDIADGHVISLEGAGEAKALVGRTAQMGIGSNNVNMSGGFGNFYFYPGQMIGIVGAGIAGAELVGYVGALGLDGDFTLVNAAGAALNASTPVATATVKAYAPLVARVTAGGGTATLTIDTNHYNNTSVINAKIRHWCPAVYAKTQIFMYDCEAGGSCQGGLVLTGRTTGGEVADNCYIENCLLAGFRFGVHTQGNDGQVNTFMSCDFAGSWTSVLENSYIGNYYIACHWAFNNAFQFFNGQSHIISGYVEANTGWWAAGGMFFGTVSLTNGGGLMGFGPYGSTLQGPALRLKGPLFAEDNGGGSGALNTYGGVVFDNSPLGGNSVIVQTGASGGNRLRFFGNAASGFYISCATDIFLNAETGDIQFRRADITKAKVVATGIDLLAGNSLSVAGTKVVGAQGAAIADASNAAAAPTQAEFNALVTVVNTLLARLRAGTGHGLIA